MPRNIEIPPSVLNEALAALQGINTRQSRGLARRIGEEKRVQISPQLVGQLVNFLGTQPAHQRLAERIQQHTFESAVNVKKRPLWKALTFNKLTKWLAILGVAGTAFAGLGHYTGVADVTKIPYVGGHMKTMFDWLATQATWLSGKGKEWWGQLTEWWNTPAAGTGGALGAPPRGTGVPLDAYGR